MDYQIIEIINFISRRKRSYSLKKAQQIAGYLNYYLAIAGPTVYKIVTFYLHNFDRFNSHKAWWSLMVRKLLTINHMKFNKTARLNNCTIINQLHVDASLTHAALYSLEEDYHEVVPIQYDAPIYVAEIEAAYMGIKHIILKANEDHTQRGRTAYQLYTDNCIVYYLLNRGRGRLNYINNKVLLEILFLFTLASNYLLIEVFFVPSSLNLADRFTRPA